MEGWRVVISLSISRRNPDAVTVAEALAAQNIPLTHGGAQILAWAAAYLSGATMAPTAPPPEDPGISQEELDTLLDDF